MKIVRASAPGKMVVMGDYAALLGAPAVVTAVQARATVELAPHVDGFVAQGGSEPARTARLEPDGYRFVDDTSDFYRLTACVLDAVRAHGVVVPNARVMLSSEALHVGVRGEKLGLGSSAAIACALTGALLSCAASDIDGAAVALHAHDRFSHGQGSGLDVATSWHGGTIVYERSPGHPPHISACPTLPTDLGFLVVWTGKAQDTRRYVAAVRAFQRDRPRRADLLLSGLGNASRAYLRACTRGDAEGVLESVDSARVTLAALGGAAGIDIVSRPHREVATVAARFAAAAKPSGAGGGDIALCVGPLCELDALRDALAESGYPEVPLDLGGPGTSVVANDEGV